MHPTDLLLNDYVDEGLAAAERESVDRHLQDCDRCRAIGFEPDEDECERLRNHYQDRPSVEIVAHALGSEPGPATLYITREPACSSVYQPIDDVVDRHPRLEPQRLAARRA